MKRVIAKRLYLLVIALILCFGFLFSTIFVNHDTNAYAQVTTENNKMVRQDFIEESTSDSLNNEENYHYSRGIDSEFMIKNVNGNVSVEGGKIVLCFEDKTLNVPNFDFYRIMDKNGETRFYQADTITDDEDCSAFVYIGIFLASKINEKNAIMNLQYGIEEILTLYNIKVVLTGSQVSYFNGIAKSHTLGDDELSQRLKAAAKVYRNGAYEESDNQQSFTKPKRALSTIRSGAYDSYTNADGIIHNYVSQYFDNNKISEDIVTDDPIVRIIPKELCFILGEHFYIGKEYGFFIKVVQDRLIPTDYAADVLVFDIQHTVPSFPSNVTGATKIRPLFQYRYRASDKEKGGVWTGVDPNLTKIVVAHVEYDYAEYYMNEVGFRQSLFNPTLLNPGDPGYNAIEDDGAFIIQTRYNSSGVGLKKKKQTFLADTLKFALGFIPVVGDALSIYSYVYDLSNAFGSTGVLAEPIKNVMVDDNEANINTYATNNIDQINQYGYLMKTQATTQTGDSDKPRLIHVGGYSELKYVVARRSGSTYNKMHVVTSVSANIVEDNTYRKWVFGWKEKGSVVNYGRATGTYEVSNYHRMSGAKGVTTLYITNQGEKKLLKFIPQISGSYRIQTSTYSLDPNFSITDATTKKTTNAKDDIDGDNDRNARLDIYLIAGHVYYIEAFSYTPSSEYYKLHIGYFSENSTTIVKDIGIDCLVNKATYSMYKFVPQTNECYDITAIARSGDPVLYLYDSQGYKLKEDDDGLVGRNSLIISNSLTPGKTYYIAVQCYDGEEELDCTIRITPSISFCIDIISNMDIEATVEKGTYMFEFTSPYTGIYDIYTHDRTSGDPYLELYDANRNLIAYDNDGNGDLNALITYTLVVDQTYYIRLSAYDTTVLTNCKFQIGLSTHTT